MPMITNEGVEIHYEVRGEGPAVLLHTGAGGDSRMWELAGYVSGLPGFRKILMDQRGRGRSGHPARVEAHRMEHSVSDIAAVLDDAGEGAAAFWGYSNGIFFGLAFGATYPSRLKALLGIGTLPDYDLCDLPPIDDPEALIEECIANGGVSKDVDEYMKQDNERFPESIDRNVRGGDSRMYGLGRVARRSWRGPKSLYSRFGVPSLILTGEREADEGMTELAVAAMPKARMIRLPGLGHLASFYRSDIALRHALPFLRQNLAV